MRPIQLTLLLVVFALSATVAGRPVSGADPEPPPNIVILLADDFGWGDVGFNGRREWRTPRLDRLAREGMQFNRWYTGAVVCAPSRAVLLTGRYGIHNGVPGNSDDLPAEETTLAEALKPRGYRTGLFGKWHHGTPRDGRTTYVHPMDQGFDEFYGYTGAREAWEKFPTRLWDGRQEVAVRGYADTLFATRAVDFIHRHRKTPFFLYVPFINTHFNIDAPPEDVARHRGRFPEDAEDKPVRATYAAMAERLDTEIGRVLDAIDDLGLARRTLVVFTSDHGATFEAGNRGASAFHDSNRPFRGQKRNLWEGGIRVPGVVRWPGRTPAGKHSDQPVHMADVFPTCLAAAGGSPDPAWMVDGANILAHWSGKGDVPERALFWEWRSEGYNQLATMRGRMKLIVTGNTPPELFDVEDDPGERRSLAGGIPALARQMKAELDTWLTTETPASRSRRRPAMTTEGATSQTRPPPPAPAAGG